MVCLLRYAQVIEHSHRCWVNTSALVSGCTNAVGLVMVGNFQVSALRPAPVPEACPPSDGSGGASDASVCLSGGSRQVSPLRWGRGGVPSRPAVRVSAVCSHLPGGRHRAGLLDGPLPGGSGSGSDGVPRPQYPSPSSGTSSVQIHDRSPFVSGKAGDELQSEGCLVVDDVTRRCFSLTPSFLRRYLLRPRELRPAARRGHL